MLPSVRTTRLILTTTSRKMLFHVFLALLCLVGTHEAAPLDVSDDSTRQHESSESLSSSLPPRSVQEEQVGNPSELAWQAWLLVDGHTGSQSSGAMDSASLLRRITPKSIFIAPALTDCPEGYQDDTMNRCVKDVNIDHQAHMGFLLERLKVIYSKKPQAAASSAPSSSSSIPSGPLQLNIPLLMSAPAIPHMESQKSEIPEVEKSTPEPAKIIAGESPQPGQSENHRDAIVTVYELNEDAPEEESTFFLGNKSTESVDKNRQSNPTRTEAMVPVAEIVDETSGNSTSGIVDYKIPDALEKILNRTRLTENNEELDENREKLTETDVSPTLVLLLSPTKVPSITLPGKDLIVAHNSSLGQVLIKMENVTGNSTAKEIISVSVTDAVTSTVKINSVEDGDTEESTTITKTVDDLVSGDDNREIVEEEEEEEEVREATTEAYEDANYEESTENEDEILKHSEAGMTVTIRDRVTDTAAPTTTTTSTTQGSEDNETTGSSEISSEVSINGDFVRETTLVDFNVSDSTNSTSTTVSRIEETSTNVPIAPNSFEIVEKDFDTDAVKGDEKLQSNDKNFGLEKKDKIDDTEKWKKMEKEPIIVYPVSPIEEIFDTGDEISTTEKSDSDETMIAASTNEARPVISREPPKFDSSSSTNKRGQPLKFDDFTTTTTKIPSTRPKVEGVYDYEPVPRDYPRRPTNGYHVDESPPVIRTIDEQQRYRPENDDEEHFFGSQQQRQQQQQDYVRFPSYDRLGRPNFVRFPSEEANSIHSPSDYKDRNRRPYVAQRYQAPNYVRGTSTTKNLPGQEIRQKQSYWWVPPGWRMDRQQQQQPAVAPHDSPRTRSGSVEQRPRDRAPMLLRFWTRMPLVRDPSLNHQPTRPTLSASSRSDTRISSSSYSSSHNSRRVNYYKEMSTQDLGRAFARKSMPMAIGG